MKTHTAELILGHESPSKSTGGFKVYGVAGRESCGGVTRPVPLVPVPLRWLNASAVRVRSLCVWLFGAMSCWGPFPLSREPLTFNELNNSVVLSRW
jgi:hypothetical protein